MRIAPWEPGHHTEAVQQDVPGDATADERIDGDQLGLVPLLQQGGARWAGQLSQDIGQCADTHHGDATCQFEQFADEQEV
jgi:hypothetical protein